MNDKPPKYMTKWDGNWKFFLMMVAFVVLAIFLQNNQTRQDVVIVKQNDVIAQQVLDQKIFESTKKRLLETQDLICADQNAFAIKHNKLVDDLKVSTLVKIQPIKCPPIAR